MEAFRAILEELLAILAPLVDAAQDPDKLVDLLDDLGWNANSIPQPLQELAQVGMQVSNLIGTDTETVPITQIVDAIKNLINAINALSSKPNSAFPSGIDIASFKATIGRDLLDYCIVEYFLRDRQKLGGILKLAGFIRLTPVAAVGLRQAHIKREVMWTSIGLLLTNPAQGFREIFDWNGGSPKLADALADLASLLESYGLDLSYFEPSGSVLTFMNTGAITPLDEPLAIDLAFDETVGAPEGISFGVQLLLLPPTGSRGPAIAFLPYAKLSGATEISLSDTFALSIRGNADFSNGVAITLAPNKPPEVKSGIFNGSGSVPAEALIGLKLVPPASQPERIIFGTADGTHMSIRSATLSVGAQILSPSKVDVLAALDLDKMQVVIKPSAEDADSFLASFMGDGITTELSLGLQLSSLTGFHLKASGGLEATFPLHIALGPIDIQSLTLALKLSGQDIVLETGASLAGQLGPLAAVVENAGFKLTVRFPDPPNGNLGPFDLSLGFKPPNGVGLSIDAGPVSGGGYLFFDFDKQEYAGVLQLDLASIVTVTAIGLVTTRMPDGSSGFSLLIIISAEFGTGIQLGFGFTLLGVGGLVGLNRTMNLQALAEGVKNGALNNIMFPSGDVIANALRIISDLRNFFPPENGKFLIGPMVKIGWGTPTLISLTLGIIIEIPGNIAIVGVLRLALPTSDAALIVLQVSFIGALEFDKSRVWFFATLFESRVLFFTIEGDMGLLMAFGADANFVLSVGGFHPAFNPPPLPFPSPRRLSFSIISTDVALIRVELYFAVTSNTVQVGAHAQLKFGFDDFGIQGHIGFDVLIQFSPFYFIATISASVSLRVFGFDVFSIRLRFELSGPSGWRAKGEGSLSILFFEISADFDISWGEKKDTSLPPVPIIPMLTAELDKLENWKAELPAANNLLVSLRKLDAATEALVLHPVGTLRISQKTIPLDLAIDKVGNQKPNDAKRFSLEVVVGGLGKAGNTSEQFAIAQFQNMDDTKKLSRPAYQALTGGVQLSVTGAQYRTGHTVRRVIRYEQIIIDNNYKRFIRRFKFFVFSLFNHFLSGSAIARSELSYQVKTQYQPFKEKVSVKQDGYTVAYQANNKVYGTATFSSEAAARDFMRQAIDADPNQAEALHVIPQFEVTP